MALGWFRRNQKLFLAVLTAFLMVTWGLGTYWASLFTPTQYAGEIFGTKIPKAKFEAFEKRWRAAFSNPETEPKNLRDILWQQFAMVQEAERAGLDVSSAEVDAQVKQMVMRRSQGRPFSEGAYEFFIRAHKTSREEYEEAIRERMLVGKLQALVADQAILSNTQVWERYARDNAKMKVRHLALKPEYFVPNITVTEAQIKDFYEEHANDIAEPANGVVGYKLKEAAQAEVVLANYSELEKRVKVSDEDVKKYYEEHKDSFKIEPKKEEPKKEEAKKEELKKEEGKKPESKKDDVKPAAGDAKKDPKKADPPAADDAKKDTKKADPAAPASNKAAAPPAKPEGAKEPKAAEAKPGAEGVKPAEPSKTPPAPEFKPLAEVKDEIRRTLAAKEAQHAAKDLIKRADDQIMPEWYKTRHVDLSAVTKDLQKEGLIYLKTPFFTKDEDSAVPAIPRFATEAFGKAEWEPSSKAEGPEGWYMYQVIAHRPSQVQALSTVREQVIKDLKAELAMKKAKELAGQCEKIANEKGLEAALAEAQKEVPKLPETKPAPPAPKEKGKEKAPPAKALAPEVLKIQESEYFTRPQPMPMGYGGDNELHQFTTGLGGDRPNVARVAFDLKDKAVGLAIEESGEKACYLLQVADRKPADPAEFKKDVNVFRQRYLLEEQMAVETAWMENLKKHIHLLKEKGLGRPLED